MSWTLADPGLPPLPDGRTPTPPVASDPNAHAKSVRWIAAKFKGSVQRGRATRRRWSAVSDEKLIDARRGLAMEVRHFTADPSSPKRVRQPLADRALALELSETAAAARDLVTEIGAIGLRLGVKR